MRLLLGTLLISFLIIGLLLLRVRPSVSVVKAVPTPTITMAPYIPDDADDLFQTVNEWRIKEGYQPHKKSEFACNVAETRLSETKINWSHDGFRYDRFCESCTISENLAKGFIFADRTLNGWLSSPPHRKALEADYTHSCIKCDSGYCVQIFSYF